MATFSLMNACWVPVYMSRNARSSRLPSRIEVVPAARWAHSAHALAVSVANTAATRMSARILGVSSLPAASGSDPNSTPTTDTQDSAFAHSARRTVPRLDEPRQRLDEPRQGLDEPRQ